MKTKYALKVHKYRKWASYSGTTGKIQDLSAYLTTDVSPKKQKLIRAYEQAQALMFAVLKILQSKSPLIPKSTKLITPKFYFINYFK